MLNIFAEAMLLATRMGQLSDNANRRSPREFQDIEALKTADRLRNQAR